MHWVRLAFGQGLNLVLVQGMRGWNPSLAHRSGIHLHVLAELGRVADPSTLRGLLLQDSVHKMDALLVATVTGLRQVLRSHSHELPGGTVGEEQVNELCGGNLEERVS